jgi:hypothetical protein
MNDFDVECTFTAMVTRTWTPDELTALAGVSGAGGGWFATGRYGTCRVYRVTRDVPAGEPHNYADCDVPEGTTLFEYRGVTWGAVDDEGGVAVCAHPHADTFFEFPVDALRQIGVQP